MTTEKSLGERIKKLRLVDGITANKLAMGIGIAPNAVSRYERDIVSPNSSTLAKIATYFDVSTDYLLGLPNNNKEIVIVQKIDSFSNQELLNELRKRLEESHV